MKEKPILFNGEMVRAILAGRKTQTRRIVKEGPRNEYNADPIWDLATPRRIDNSYRFRLEVPVLEDGSGQVRLYPSHSVGDRLWVRENFLIDDERFYPKGPLPTEAGWIDPERIVYVADWDALNPPRKLECKGLDKIKWRPSIHMPRWASRTMLRIVDLKVERIAEISCDDIIAEGISRDGFCSNIYNDPDNLYFSMQLQFRRLWDKINGNLKDKEGNRLPYAFKDNPWVWVYEFERVFDET